MTLRLLLIAAFARAFAAARAATQRMSRAPGLLSSLVLLAIVPTTLAGQEPRYESLAQLRGLYVEIEPLDSAVTLDTVILKDAIERRLADGGVPVASDAEWEADPFLPFLNVHVGVGRDSASGDLSYSIDVGVYELVTFWQTSVSHGPLSDLATADTLRAKALATVDGFLRDYRAANPPGRQPQPGAPSPERNDLAGTPGQGNR
jgi:hypothetical protein